MIKILHFSPVKKPPEILKLHLESLENLNKDEFDLTFSFFDDNENPESSELLHKFISSNKNSILFNFDFLNFLTYKGSNRWAPELYSRITVIKNRVIESFLNGNYDMLFLTDSDLILHPQTLNNLILKKKDFCSTIFWTHFEGTPTYTPNAWFSKPKGFDPLDLKKFKEDGTYPVDFTGACTLLSRKILQDGVSFTKIPNLHYLGEDKHFCIRAAVMGYQAFVDTKYPAFHVYSLSNVKLGKKILRNHFNYSFLIDWLDSSWEKKIEEWLRGKNRSLISRIIKKITS